MHLPDEIHSSDDAAAGMFGGVTVEFEQHRVVILCAIAGSPLVNRSSAEAGTRFG
jgi:hypothetical protein